MSGRSCESIQSRTAARIAFARSPKARYTPIGTRKSSAAASSNSTVPNTADPTDVSDAAITVMPEIMIARFGFTIDSAAPITNAPLGFAFVSCCIHSGPVSDGTRRRISWATPNATKTRPTTRPAQWLTTFDRVPWVAPPSSAATPIAV